MSDSDSAFRGDNRDEDQNLQKTLSSSNSVLKSVKLNDHHALVVINIFAKNWKRVLSKENLDNKDTEWVSILPKIIEQYNNTVGHTTHSIKQYNAQSSNIRP